MRFPLVIFLLWMAGMLFLARPSYSDQFDDLRQALRLVRPHVALEGQQSWRAQDSGKQVGQIDLHQAIIKASQKHGVPASVLATIVKIESDASPCAVSSAGAIGLAQLMPATARSYQVLDPFDPEQNLTGSSHLLRDLLLRHDGNLLAVAAAYNAGDKVLARSWNRWPSETRGYLKKILRYYPQFTDGRWKQQLPRYVPASDRDYCRMFAKNR